jgi:protein tyrosine phosphatase
MTTHTPPNPLNRIISLASTGPTGIVLRFVDQIHRKRTGAPHWKLSEITPQLFCGGQHYPAGYQEMLDKGITAIVNMREAHIRDEDKGIGGHHHLHLATRDNTPPSVADLSQGVDFINQHITNNGKVYIHCGVGVGRAPTMTAAYLVSTGMTPDDALDKIRKHRPFIHLTSTQRDVLYEFSQYWHEK